MKSNRRILILIVTLFVVISTFIDCSSNNIKKKLEFLAQKTDLALQKSEASAKKAETETTLSNKFIKFNNNRINKNFTKNFVTNKIHLLTNRNKIPFYKKIIIFTCLLLYCFSYIK